jgi:hypothetical protein
LITPVNVGTWKLLLEGKTIKTDIKHRDKEGIARLPVWITTAAPITGHVDNNETSQIMQRVKIFLYKYSIDHRGDIPPGTATENTRIFRRAPTHITTQHLAYLWLQNQQAIIQAIETLDETHVRNPDRIELPHNLATKATQCLNDLGLPTTNT